MNAKFDECKRLSIATAAKKSNTMLKSATLVFWILKNKYPYDDKAKNKAIYSKLFTEQNIDELKKINKNAIIKKIDKAFNSWERIDDTRYVNVRTGAMELIFNQYSVTAQMFGVSIDDANELLDIMWKLGFVNYKPDTNEAYIDEDYYDSAENYSVSENIVFQCNSCGGDLEKDGNVYICKQCGEVFKNEYTAEQGNIEVHKESVFPTSSTSANMPQTQKSGGCYVATCVYGSYNCPQVWTLRRYRDNTLAKTWHGRAFIHTYYAISPTIVKWFGNTIWFKKLWRGKLDKMVRNLNNDGVSNAPYEDRSW